MELVRRVTGHATVDIVLRHYFRPGREQFRDALAEKLPDVLTGETAGGPADNLVALAEKVTGGTATTAEKARLKALASQL